MRANAVLATLSLGDLNQRYESSYAVYKGKPCYIGGFTGTNSKPEIFGDAISRSIPTELSGFREAFNWRDLDVSRPLAGWYLVETVKGTAPVHLSYNIMRQWRRGLCPRNTTMLSTEEGVLKGDAFHGVLAYGDSPIPNRRVSVEEVLDTKGTFIPRQRVLLTTRGKETQMLVATRKVAVIDAKKKRIRVLSAFDPIEVQDVLMAPGWEIVPIPEFERKAKLYTLSNRFGGRMAGFMPPEVAFDRVVEAGDFDEPRVRRAEPQRHIQELLYEVLGRGGSIPEFEREDQVLDDVYKFFQDFINRIDLDEAFFPDGNMRLEPFERNPVSERGGMMWVMARQHGGGRASIHNIMGYPLDEYNREGPGGILDYYKTAFNTPANVEAFTMGIVSREGLTVGVVCIEPRPYQGNINLICTCMVLV